jgi:hypothetical protein
VGRVDFHAQNAREAEVSVRELRNQHMQALWCGAQCVMTWPVAPPAPGEETARQPGRRRRADSEDWQRI